MKKTILIALLAIPFLGFGQDISGTGWKITEEDGDKKILLFKEDGTFIHLNVKGASEGYVFGDDDETWELDGNKVVILFNDGYKIFSGTINTSGDFITGTLMNRKGVTQKWSGELINF